jgi:hypothetical protein
MLAYKKEVHCPRVFIVFVFLSTNPIDVRGTPETNIPFAVKIASLGVCFSYV